MTCVTKRDFGSGAISLKLNNSRTDIDPFSLKRQRWLLSWIACSSLGGGGGRCPQSTVCFYVRLHNQCGIKILPELASKLTSFAFRAVSTLWQECWEFFAVEVFKWILLPLRNKQWGPHYPVIFKKSLCKWYLQKHRWLTKTILFYIQWKICIFDFGVLGCFKLETLLFGSLCSNRVGLYPAVSLNVEMYETGGMLNFRRESLFCGYTTSSQMPGLQVIHSQIIIIFRFATMWVSSHHVPGGEKPSRSNRHSGCNHLPEIPHSDKQWRPRMSPTDSDSTADDLLTLHCLSPPCVQDWVSLSCRGSKLTSNLFLP